MARGIRMGGSSGSNGVNINVQSKWANATSNIINGKLVVTRSGNYGESYGYAIGSETNVVTFICNRPCSIAISDNGNPNYYYYNIYIDGVKKDNTTLVSPLNYSIEANEGSIISIRVYNYGLSNGTTNLGIEVTPYTENIKNLIPLFMTSNMSPSTYGTCGATYEFQTHLAWQVFNGDKATDGWSASNRANEIVYYNFNNKKMVKRVILTTEKSTNFSASSKDWDIVASDDGVTWTTIASGSNPDSKVDISIQIDSNVSYYYWGIRIKTSFRSDSYSISELQFLGY